MKRNPFLRVKLKSLAAEARIIRKEELRFRFNPSIHDSLYLHRVKDVRREARVTLLAYQYLRGIPYKAVESLSHTAPDWSRVERLVKKYGHTELDPEWSKIGTEL